MARVNPQCRGLQVSSQVAPRYGVFFQIGAGASNDALCYTRQLDKDLDEYKAGPHLATSTTGCAGGRQGGGADDLEDRRRQDRGDDATLGVRASGAVSLPGLQVGGEGGSEGEGHRHEHAEGRWMLGWCPDVARVAAASSSTPASATTSWGRGACSAPWHRRKHGGLRGRGKSVDQYAPQEAGKRPRGKWPWPGG